MNFVVADMGIVFWWLLKMKRGNVVPRMHIWTHSVFRRQTSTNNMAIRFLENYRIFLLDINATFLQNSYRKCVALRE